MSNEIGLKKIVLTLIFAAGVAWTIADVSRAIRAGEMADAYEFFRRQPVKLIVPLGLFVGLFAIGWGLRRAPEALKNRAIVGAWGTANVVASGGVIWLLYKLIPFWWYLRTTASFEKFPPERGLLYRAGAVTGVCALIVLGSWLGFAWFVRRKKRDAPEEHGGGCA